VPRIARASVELLAPNVNQYVFISSVSAYGDPSKIGLEETDAVGTIDDPTVEQITGESYGPLKALCEQAVEEAMPGRATNIRPGLIVGPEDGSDRFTYWPVRVAQGGEILAPGSPDDPVQIIDVRDLAEFCIHCVEQRHMGIYNACGPEGTMTMAMMLHGCWAASGGDASFTWASAEFLESQGIGAWLHMPVWIPPGGESSGICQTSNRKAVAAGMTFRPLAETVRDTLAWLASEPAEEQRRLSAEAEYATAETPQDQRRFGRRAGISAAREQEVLAAWKNRGG
jgi:2'-hydroxyisoflavone reductase